MEIAEILAALLLLMVLVGAIAGFVANARIGRLQREVTSLRAHGQWLARAVESMGREEAPSPASPPAAAPAPSAASPAPTGPTPTPDLLPTAPKASPTHAASVQARLDALRQRQRQADDAAAGEAGRPILDERWGLHLQQHWMTWLGGACVALAGIFLVRYSMDRGWLGPLARIVAALATGGALLGVAEYLRRRQGGAQPALAALAGAGCITLYGALLAAMRLYDLIGPGAAFGAMALVALGTMGLALLHGPVLAAFGMLGAYLVPIFVSTGTGDVRIVLIYALIISASALLLLRYVYRPWLWWGAVAGALGWWLLSLGASGADGLRTAYLTAFAYLVAAAPTGDWRLHRDYPQPEGSHHPLKALRSLDTKERDAVLTHALAALATGLSILANPSVASPWWLGLPFFAFTLWLARHRDAVFLVPWVTLLVILGAWLLAFVDAENEVFTLRAIGPESANTFLVYLALYALLSVGMGLWLFVVKTSRTAAWASLATLSPVLLITLAYLLLARPDGNTQWGVLTLMLGLVYLASGSSVVRKPRVDSLAVWLFIAGHFALGVAATMIFDAASLTLAIAAQLISLAWVIRRFALPGLGWLYKLVISFVIVRLTFNPWLASYPVDMHWSLWTYGGAALCAAFAAHWLRSQPALGRWAEGAALHLGVLTVWSEIRYQLYDGLVYAPRFELTEAALAMVFAGAMGLVYHHRAKRSETLARVFRAYGHVLVAVALVLYAVTALCTVLGVPWVYESIGQTRVINLLLLLFGVPVLLGLAYRRWYAPPWREPATAFTGVSALAFVTVEIRHLFTGTVHPSRPQIEGAELYTYSVVWLAMALALLLGGRWRLGPQAYRAGLGLLGLVIAKVFLIDLSDLDGLLRVASFMGLGLSLLGVAYLHQRLGEGVASTTS
ncbi:MAG: DUF2339 domain-containing protein [Pseudomonadota bacterium]